MAMVIHHGGSGTTACGLRAGVPSLVVPFVFDQFYWGERIAALGVGPPPIRYHALSVERLKEAILLGITNTQIRQKAAELGDRIRAEKGLEQAVNLTRRFTG
jgi:UDP:flavonoid glycosyltransferase YjiC (YdhE family)